MNRETYVLGMFNDNIWSFFNGEDWIYEVHKANRLDKDIAFELCEKFALENLQVCIFKSAIFDVENCPLTFSFEDEEEQ